jgi:hypothetical protein
MFLPESLEQRWELALMFAPERSGIVEVNLPEILERRWEEALSRAPASIAQTCTRASSDSIGSMDSIKDGNVF